MRRARARDINLRYSRVTSVVVEPDFRLLWIRGGYVIEDQPLQRGSWPQVFGGIAGVVTGSASVRSGACVSAASERVCVRL